MPAVDNALVIGARLVRPDGRRSAGRRRRRRRPDRDQAGGPRPRLRDHPAGQCPAGPPAARRARRVRRSRLPEREARGRAADADATVLAEMQNVRSGGPDLPANMGIYRPDLARVLMTRAERAEVKARFSTSVRSLDQDVDGVNVTFADGSTGHLRGGHRGRRAAVGDAADARHRARGPAGRHGDLAVVRPAATQGHGHGAVLRRPLLHRRLRAHLRHHALRLPHRGRPGPLLDEPRRAGRHGT